MTTTPHPDSTVTELPVGAIRPGRNDRKAFNDRELAELAASIDAVGRLIQPITVRPVDEALDGTRYEIVAGERRWRAHQLLGWATIRAHVEDVDDQQASLEMLVENLQRADLNPVEEAEAYAERMGRFGQSLEEVARIAGVQPQVVRSRLALLELCPEALELVRTGQLGRWYGAQLGRLDHNRQIMALRSYQRMPNMAWDDFAAMVEALLGEQNQEVLALDGDVLRIEEYVLGRERAARKATRSELLATIAGLVDVLEGLGDLVGPEEHAAIAAGRSALEGENARKRA